MSLVDAKPILELDELLDSSRLAAAWQVAHERTAPTAAPAVTAASRAASSGGGAVGGDAAVGALGGDLEVTALDEPTARSAGAAAATPAVPPPLPVPEAYRNLLDEIDRTLAAAPAVADHARPTLEPVLTRLAAALALTAPDPAAPDPATVEPAATAPAAVDPAAAAPAAVDPAAAEAVLDELEDLLQALLVPAGWPTGGEE